MISSPNKNQALGSHHTDQARGDLHMNQAPKDHHTDQAEGSPQHGPSIKVSPYTDQSSRSQQSTPSYHTPSNPDLSVDRQACRELGRDPDYNSQEDEVTNP